MEERSLVLELFGLPAAGKSTVDRKLRERDTTIQPLPLPSTLGYLPYAASNVLPWVPTYLTRYRRTRWFTWKEIRLMTYLATFPSMLVRRGSAAGVASVMNPGAVYWLSYLRELGPELTKSPAYVDWWQRKFDQWMSILDIVVWLDASDDVLMERIDARDTWRHRVKEMSRQEAMEFLVQWRARYAKMVSVLADNGGPRVLSFRTDEVSVDDVVNEVLAAIALERNGR
jgi:shikimate kinase